MDVGSDEGAALLDEHAETRAATDDDYKRLNAVLARNGRDSPYRLDFDVTELPR